MGLLSGMLCPQEIILGGKDVPSWREAVFFGSSFIYICGALDPKEMGWASVVGSEDETGLLVVLEGKGIEVELAVVNLFG